MSLGLANAVNARDLGGVHTGDGRVVRTGRLYRSGSLHRLTEEDLDTIDRLGLACVIDLRHEAEIELIGPDRLPPGTHGRLVALPLYDPEDDLITKLAAAVAGRGDLAVLERLRSDHPDGGAAVAMRGLYRWFVSSPVARATFGSALRLTAREESLPLLFHCTAGKDRTGWLAALVLAALEVDRETIMAEYRRTNELSAAHNDFLVARAAARIPDVAPLRPLLEARPEYLATAFDEVDAAWGGMAAYLRQGLGLDDADLARLRELHLQEA